MERMRKKVLSRQALWLRSYYRQRISSYSSHCVLFAMLVWFVQKGMLFGKKMWSEEGGKIS
jgi:hypothetical protein